MKAKQSMAPEATAAASPAADAGRYPVAFPPGPWRAQIALRIRRQVLAGKASPSLLGALGWPVPRRS